MGAALAHVTWTVPERAPLRVRLLQGNIPQDLKFIDARFDETAAVYMNLIERSSQPADLIVLPETAFPRFFDRLPKELIARLKDDGRRVGASIAFGAPVEDSAGNYFNSVIAFSGKGATAAGAGDPLDATSNFASIQRYDKSHLVPFGEFIPLGFHWFVELMHIPLGDFTRGTVSQKPMSLALQNVAFNICYEDLFGDQIRRQAKYANILVNVSNVAWFGDSLALPQHLRIGRMRSLETGKPMLRATNTGMTASIDPTGKVLGQLAPFTVGSLDVSVQGMTGVTPYVRYGDTGVVLLALALLLLAVVRGRAR